MMYKLTFLFLTYLSAARGFLSSQPLVAPLARVSTKVHVSFPLPPEGEGEGEEAPEGFGRPLSDDTKEINKKVVYMIKKVIFDNIFSEDSVERAFARFWALEEIARMPYFSFLTALHFYETIGMWRKSEYLKIHFAETWNEQHHLLIMEELGGSELWFTRFLAQHMAIGYFWIALLFYFVNPVFAYNFNQAVEEEAFETYDRFLEKNEEYLKGQPAPSAAIDYYNGDDTLYMLESITKDGEESTSRRPKLETLYDCFAAIRADEGEHVKTMSMMQEELL